MNIYAVRKEFRAATYPLLKDYAVSACVVGSAMAVIFILLLALIAWVGDVSLPTLIGDTLGEFAGKAALAQSSVMLTVVIVGLPGLLAANLHVETLIQYATVGVIVASFASLVWNALAGTPCLPLHVNFATRWLVHSAPLARSTGGFLQGHSPRLE